MSELAPEQAPNDSKSTAGLAPERVANGAKPSEELAPERVDAAEDQSRPPDPGVEHRRARRESRTVPAEVRRSVSERDAGRCTFVDPKTGRRCDERRFITFEHIDPYALGGTATVSNIRLLCSQHHALLARRAFGDQYVAAAVTRRGSKRKSDSLPPRPRRAHP
jgi:hypothetical protein